MSTLLRRLALLVISCVFGTLEVHGQAPRPPKTVPPMAVLVDDEGNREKKVALDASYAGLRERWTVWMRRAGAFNRTHADRDFPEGSPEATAGAIEQAWLARELDAYRKAAARFSADVPGLRIDRARSIALMASFAERQHWDRDKAEQARSLMMSLQPDGDADARSRSIADTWLSVQARDWNRAAARSYILQSHTRALRELCLARTRIGDMAGADAVIDDYINGGRDGSYTVDYRLVSEMNADIAIGHALAGDTPRARHRLKMARSTIESLRDVEEGAPRPIAEAANGWIAANEYLLNDPMFTALPEHLKGIPQEYLLQTFSGLADTALSLADAQRVVLALRRQPLLCN